MASRGGAFRGRGRGGFRGRGRPAGGASSGQHQHLDADFDAEDSEPVEEAPEIALLRQTYANSLNTIKSIFPQYTDEEILLTVQEANGQADVAIARIAEGYISTFTAKKPKQQQQQAARREQQPSSSQADQAASSGSAGFPNSGFAGQTRGGPRGAARGAFTGRGRGGDFRGGRGAARGGRGGIRPSATNGHVSSTDTPELATATTTVETTEGDGWGEVTITQTTESADAAEVVQTTETIIQEDSVPQAAPVSAAPAPPAAKPASKVIQPGAKMSWAQIARPPPQAQPKPAQAQAPAPAASAPKEPETVTQAPVEVVIVSEPITSGQEATSESTAISTADLVSALAGEAAPLLSKEESTTVSQDPWAPAVPEATTPAALPVGEGWADAVAAAKEDAVDLQSVLQHQRAEAAAPPAGVDPAGPLDVHTPAPEALPAQQAAFDQPSALASVSAQEPARGQAVPSALEKLVSPPGLAKRGSTRVQQDAPVVISGNGATPSVDGVGVQFGSLSLFGNFDADPSQAAAPEQQQQQATSPAVSQQIQLPGQQQQSQQNIQRSLYETPTSLEQKVQEALQPAHQSSFPASTTDHNQFGAYQQSQQQPFGQQSSYGQDRLSGLGGYGGQYQQQQASAIPSQTSAYASRYPQQQSAFGQQAQSQGQQQQAHDSFASLTANANASAYGQQTGGLGTDAISPYYSSAQHNLNLGHQSAPSPAPASSRDISSLASQTAPASNSAYGGFTSAIGQAQQQQSQGYPNDYASLYGLQQQQQQEPMRSLNQYEQFAQQHGRQIQTGEDSTAKLGSTVQTALGGAPSAPQGTPALPSQQQGQQQQAQQQQQGYPPNFAPYGYPYHHYYGMPPYNQQQQGYPGYPSHHSPYAPYPGYGPPGGASTNRYPGQQQQQANASQGGYRGGYGGNSTGSAGGVPHPSSYGSYAGFDSSRTSAQGQTNNSQDTRNSSAKDVFGDRYFSGQY